MLCGTGAGYRIAGTLETTDWDHAGCFWIGVYPGMNDEMIDRMIEVIQDGIKWMI
jgi:CDP-6-deoxy-D-xylo-4-hexulose-3-dehydrase